MVARTGPGRRSHLIAWVGVLSEAVALMAEKRIARALGRIDPGDLEQQARLRSRRRPDVCASVQLALRRGRTGAERTRSEDSRLSMTSTIASRRICPNEGEASSG